MFYLDTSAAVAAHTPEAATGRIQTWLRRTRADELRASRWVLTEFASALSLKLRTGALTADQRALVLANWTQFITTEIRLIEVTPDAFDAATIFAARHDLGLRAGDALHLAVAVSSGCTVVTLDERMAKAAPELGVSVAEIG